MKKKPYKFVSFAIRTIISATLVLPLLKNQSGLISESATKSGKFVLDSIPYWVDVCHFTPISPKVTTADLICILPLLSSSASIAEWRRPDSIRQWLFCVIVWVCGNTLGAEQSIGSVK